MIYQRMAPVYTKNNIEKLKSPKNRNPVTIEIIQKNSIDKLSNRNNFKRSNTIYMGSNTEAMCSINTKGIS